MPLTGLDKIVHAALGSRLTPLIPFPESLVATQDPMQDSNNQHLLVSHRVSSWTSISTPGPEHGTMILTGWPPDLEAYQSWLRHGSDVLALYLCFRLLLLR